MNFPQENQRATLQKYIENMPTFSPVMAKIVQLTNNLNTPASEIVAAIRLDPVLTGKVLQLVNSAYFSLAQKVTSLNRALVYLGINTVKNLALSAAVMGAFDTKDKELASLIKPTWKHSMATAVCAKSIAKTVRVPSAQIEEYFIAGLLHKVGQIVLMQAFYSTDRHDGQLSIEEERVRYGMNHGDVGAEILRNWKFSEDLVGALASYHSPSAQNAFSCFIHVADAMTYRLGLNDAKIGGDESRTITPNVWAVIGLSEEQVLAGLDGAAEQIEKAEVFLNISSVEGVKEQL